MGRDLIAIQTDTKVNLKSGSGFTPQSLALISSKQRIVLCSGSSPNHVLKCDASSYSDKGKIPSIGHANGGTYCNKNGLIYATAYEGSSNNKKIKALSSSNYKVQFTVILPTTASGIAYDRITNQFYISSGNKVHVYPYEAFAQKGEYKGQYSTFTKKWTDDNRDNQDLGGHNGVVMVCRSFESTKQGKNQTSYIDCYDASNGKYLKSFTSSYGELESCAVDENNYLHVLFAQDRKIIKTKNVFSLVGSASGVSSAAQGQSEAAASGLFASPDKLYTSSNYEYITYKDNYKDSIDTGKTAIKDLIEKASKGAFFTPLDTKSNIEILTSGLDTSRLPKTKVEGEVYGPDLPIALNPIEAPFVELTIGGITFGSYDSKNPKDKYPNYISGLNVIRTNGSMNEYSIELIHQVRPGSNPNYIDEILSKNGYNKITIKYGDANSNILFIDSKALLIGSNISFDFINCNIKYTIKATSSAMSIASHKRTFSSVEDKPSNIIRNLLYGDTSNDLISAFPEMADRNYVERNGLIPTDDKVTSIDEYKNINVLTYLKNLVASMSSMAYDNSSYYLIMDNDKFRIVELQSDSVAYDALLYEVDINYIDKNQVFNFSVDTNYYWPIAYEYGSNISNYNYDYKNNGEIKTYTTNSTNRLDFTSPAQQNLNNNWWTNVTEFPITAKLECRGLLNPLLLLTYIKINCLYFGNERITSGVYIVTGQQDTLSGSGYKTILSLTRVSGPQQHLTVSGRVTT